VTTIKQNIEIKNRRAGFEYILVETFVAGIQLLGTEVKSVRDGKVNIADAFCFFKKDELYVRNLNIAVYDHGNINNHEPLRIRKLLMKGRELKRLAVKVKERGFSIIPIRMFFNEKNICKIEIALAKGKKAFDKRETIKAKENKRELARVMKGES
jgi:SsrA-binding protein